MTMKKMYLMKGLAVMALGLVVASCNKNDLFDPSAHQQEQEKKFTENFQNILMEGKTIDANQTWSTTKNIQVSVTPSQSGTLKVYTANPIGNTTPSLHAATVKTGGAVTFSVSKPADLSKLYIAIVNDDDMILDVTAVEATAEKIVVDMNMPTRATRAAARRAPSRPSQPTFSGRPSMPTTYKNTLAEAKAAGATDALNGISSNGTFYLEGAAYAAKGNPWYLDIQNTPLTMYFDGNVAFGGHNYQNSRTTFCVTTGSTLSLESVRNGLTIYLAPNATLDLTKIDWCSFQNSNSAIYLNEGSKIKAKHLKLVNSVTVLNAGGTISVSDYLELDNQVLLYNEGVVECTNTSTGDNSGIYIHNTDAELVNRGTVTSKSNLILAGGGHYYNDEPGVTTVTGLTDIKNESDKWMNDGLYTSGTFKCTDTQKVYNNCRLTVTDKFTMAGSASNFVLNGDASVICDSFDWNSDNYFFLGSKSIVSVANELKSNNSNWEYGFYQSGDEYAVISAGSITTDYPNSQWRAWYSGKIYVDTDSHFDFISFNDTQKNYYKTADVLFSKEQNAAPVSWEESKCRPAYNSHIPDPDPTMYYYYAFEDLGTTDDFDFNDIVIRVSTPDDNNTCSVELLAAGGTMPTIVTYNGTALRGEVHELFEVSTTTMVNTGGTQKSFVSLGTITVAEGANLADLPFGITVTGNNGQVTKVTRNAVESKGKAPMVIVANGYTGGDNAGKWFWATERTRISDAYTSFGNWAHDGSSNIDWYVNYTEGKVYTY